MSNAAITDNDLKRISAEIRQDIVRMHQKGANVGSAMSIVDLLVVLYFRFMNIPTFADNERDRLILSKGHAAAALYAVLAKKGFIDSNLLADYLADGSLLTGHPKGKALPGIEVSTGSLGHGLPMGVGIAWALKKTRNPARVIVLQGDGELQEGSVWEGAQLASRLGLDNLITIVDVNKLQGYGRVDDLMPLHTFTDKWRSFGWEVIETDGHDHLRIAETFRRCPPRHSRPTAIIAHTVKGKGVGEMEDQLGWHYFSVPPDKVDSFILELEGQK